MTNNNKHSHKAAITLATGLFAAAATGAYFLYGSKNAKKYRSALKGWMFKAKGEILEEIEKLQDVTEEQYSNIVDMVAKKYQDVQNIDRADVDRFVSDLKKQWKGIASSLTKKKKATKARGSKK